MGVTPPTEHPVEETQPTEPLAVVVTQPTEPPVEATPPMGYPAGVTRPTEHLRRDTVPQVEVETVMEVVVVEVEEEEDGDKLHLPEGGSQEMEAILHRPLQEGVGERHLHHQAKEVGVHQREGDRDSSKGSSKASSPSSQREASE